MPYRTRQANLRRSRARSGFRQAPGVARHLIDLEVEGIADTASFEKAVALDPTHDRARAELGKLREEADGKAQKTRGAAGGIAVLLLAIAGIVLFGGGKRAARPRSIA